MKNNIIVALFVSYIIVSCNLDIRNGDCNIHSYYNDNSKKLVVCNKSDTLSFIKFDNNGDTISAYYYQITNSNDTISLSSKEFEEGRLSSIMYSSDNYRSGYIHYLSDTDNIYQYNVGGEAYYGKIISKNGYKKLETYYPKVKLMEGKFQNDTLVFHYTLPLPDSLLYADLYFKYGLTTFEEIPNDGEQLHNLFDTLIAVDSFQTLEYKNRMVKLKVDSLEKYNLIGYILNTKDQGHHGVTLIDLDTLNN